MGREEAREMQLGERRGEEAHKDNGVLAAVYVLVASSAGMSFHIL